MIKIKSNFKVDAIFNEEVFINFLREDFLSDNFEVNREPVLINDSNENGNNIFTEVYKIGEDSFSDDGDDNKLICLVAKHNGKDPRVTLTKALSKIASNMGYSYLLCAIVNDNSKTWRLSYLTRVVTVDKTVGGSKIDTLPFNRYSFLLGENTARHTPEVALLKGKVKDLDDLKERFSQEAVTEDFYRNLIKWYEKAVKVCKYPKGEGDDVELNNDEQNNRLQLIRLISRMMFVWFIKQEKLVSDWMFDYNQLSTVLNDFDKDSKNNGCYYNAILQNLFFATLNNEIEDRIFASLGGDVDNSEYGIKTFFRDDKDKTFYKINHDEFINKFKNIPYLNGGLFECLDKNINKEEKVVKYVDGFSRESSRRAFVPNYIFFNEDEKEGFIGLIPLFKMYNWTVEESSPIDVSVSLDPELLGKVFESLLAFYNPETEEKERKKIGAFYTPRYIVDFMVRESLKNHLKNNCKDVSASVIDALFEPYVEGVDLHENEKNEIYKSLVRIKVLDPAVGSGAFPMGMLQVMMEVLNKMGYQNDYDLKIEILKNCLYGVDIQPIAIQICKLRFFISLILDAKYDENNKESNYGIHTLPNLESKFVAANTLIKLYKNYDTVIEKDGSVIKRYELFDEDDVVSKQKELLKQLFFDYFDVSLSQDKISLRKKIYDVFNELNEQNLFQSESTLQIKKWDRFDQENAADFFDPEWMFNVKEFDIVIGNPPYVSTKGRSVDMKKMLIKQYGFADDLYNHFFFRGMELVKQNGELVFITSKTYWTIETKKGLRKMLLENNTINYIYDTANPFEAAVVDTAILSVKKSKTPTYENFIQFYDGTEDLNNPIRYSEKQKLYIDALNEVIFMPNELNLKLYEKFNGSVKDLYNKYWNMINTSSNIEKNKKVLEEYRATLKPGDITLLGLLTEGGQGLATANNGKYLAIREKYAIKHKVRENRAKKLYEVIKNNSKKIKELKLLDPELFTQKDVNSFLSNKSEAEIAKLFDTFKERLGRDVFGQGFIFRIIDDFKLADIDSLSQDEKDNGIDSSKTDKTWVLYDKGDKDGNRWYLDTPFAINWSKENVH